MALLLWGLGSGVNVLSDIPWLECVPVFYWGDIDVQRYQILANLRRFLPNTQNVMMDCETLVRHRKLGIPGVPSSEGAPSGLTAEERTASRLCVNENLRIEQEKTSVSELAIKLTELQQSALPEPPQDG